MNQNNSHLIAGFFRYHREKLNYSLRGLVGDGKVVDLSSLSAFENGKKRLSENQLIWLYDRIGFDYLKLIENYDFDNEYEQIVNSICLGETKLANDIFRKCIDDNVFNTLGALKFSIIGYVLSIINNHSYCLYDICARCEKILCDDQFSILKIAQALYELKKGSFNESLNLLLEAEKSTHNNKIQAWISFERGRVLGYSGNYVEATVALLDAKKRYTNFLGIIRMIHINLSLGSNYICTNSVFKAEESYLQAYRSALLLNNSTHLLTKCFNSLCWLYFKINQYEKVNNLIKNKPNELIESKNTFFVLSWANYKLGNMDDAIKYSKLGQEQFYKNEYACIIYKYIENAALGKKTGQDILLKKAIDTKDPEHNKLMDELFTYELIDIYERRKNYEKAFKYAKKLLNR